MDTINIWNLICSILGSVLSAYGICHLVFPTKMEMTEAIATMHDKIMSETKEAIDLVRDKLKEESTNLANSIKDLQHVVEDMRKSNNDVQFQVIEMMRELKDDLRHDYTKNINELRVNISEKAERASIDSINHRLSWVGERLVSIQTAMELKGILPKTSERTEE